MNQKQSINYPLQFALLIGLMGLFMIITSFLVAFIGNLVMHVPYLQVPDRLNRPENVNISRVLNTLASVLVFMLPALVLAKLLGRHPFQQLGFNTKMSSKQLLLIVMITFASMVLSGALGELNEKIPLPAKWLAQAKSLEESYKTAMMSMATMKSTADYLISLLVLAFAPALVEEILFRGGFQQVFIGWTNNKWAGIILTSILFSAIHFSYFGFLPRAALGIVLGLLFYYSKNIWLNILLHFLNNAFVVTQLYIVSRQGKSIDKTMDESMPIWWGLIAFAFLYLFMSQFKKESLQLVGVIEQNTIDSYPEKKNN
jgi:hypothetical protein